ncbi:pyridoxamine 5'-phosphate oxidase family protein [Agromyces sp. Marseille-P2726]|uniref:pyridoxamine 5'-phosphate oxidase family protein n=1 Tax=Agromyces sp. Marseille-P2726 TaxID=2709132 RepID=UPI00156D6D61|nr:pyridoxamine 5'-phosphate oxidase family protein [Agromyces sp. Marseille-P2726]
MDQLRNDPSTAEGAPAHVVDPPPDSEDERELISKLVTGADAALLTSRGADGTLHARPLAVLQKDFDGVVRFLVQHPSEKTLEIEADPMVNVSFASRQGYLSIAGRASVVRDDALIDDLWGPTAEAWFPQGREDPRIAVLEVAGDGAEYWARTEPGVFALVKAAAAIVTRRQPDIGENRSVAL